VKTYGRAAGGFVSGYRGELEMQRTGSVFCLMIGALIGMAHAALADQNIGSAAVAEKEVVRQLAGGSGRLGVGDPLFRDEVVRTGAESAAKLVFLDSTNLAVGPTSQVVLDRFVYDPSRGAEGMGVKLAKGVFRFTTGVLHEDAYSITTPTAAIGVRGTVLDISVRGSQTRVTVVKGAALVCPIKKGITFAQQARACEQTHSSKCDCKSVGVGQTAQVSGPGGTALLSPSPVQFANFCSGGSLCSSENYASLNPVAPGNPPPGNPPPATPPPPTTPGNPPTVPPEEVAPVTPPALIAAMVGDVAGTVGAASPVLAAGPQSPGPGPKPPGAAPAPELGASLFGMLLAGGVATYTRARRRRG